MSDFTLGVVNVWVGECLGGERLTIILWVAAPKNLTVENFGIWNVLPKKSLFSRISVHTHRKMLRARVRSILVPLTFHIASLGRYTQKFSGVQKIFNGQIFGAATHRILTHQDSENVVGLGDRVSVSKL